MIEVLIDHKDGRVWDVSEITEGLNWSTTRVGSPASVEFTLVNSGIFQDRAFSIENGDIVMIRKENMKIFYGYVFSVKQNREQVLSVKAYDQVRYLLNNQTYVFKNVTTGEVIRQIAADFGLQVGRIDETGYRIPSMVEDGQTLLDIIEKANTLTMRATGGFYVFLDDFGELSLRDVSGYTPELYIGDQSLLKDYDYSLDIDNRTYNRIKLYRDNQVTGRREVYIAQDSANIERWGVLQLYQSVNENLNEAQIEEQLMQLAQLHNREQKKLKLTCLGDWRVRAGMYIPIVMESLGIRQYMIVDEAKHQIDGEEHKMDLTLKII